MPGVVQKVSLVGFSHPHLTINRLRCLFSPVKLALLQQIYWIIFVASFFIFYYIYIYFKLLHSSTTMRQGI